MEVHLLDLPNELLEMLTFYVIGGPWTNDVRDFLSFTSTCRRLHHKSDDERYWKIMASRRDTANRKALETITWYDYCKQIHLMRTIPSDELQENISRYNEDYFCTIGEILLWPNKLRIYIDERGDNSFGSIQPPMTTTISLSAANESKLNQRDRISANHGEFSIEDQKSQYLGYLEFPFNISSDHIGKNLDFCYGCSGYSTIILFHIDERLIDKYNLLPLMTNPPK